MNYLLFFGLFLIPVILLFLKTYVGNSDKWFYTMIAGIFMIFFSLSLFNTEDITYVSGVNTNTTYTYSGSNIDYATKTVDYIQTPVPAINETTVATLIFLFSFALFGMSYNEYLRKNEVSSDD